MSPFQAVCRSRLAPLLTAATLVLSSIPRPARADTEGPLSAVSETQEGPTGIGTPTTPGSAAPNGFAQASVDPSTGVLRVNIPFDLLKARGNVQPTLSLSYNSNGGRGYGGDGWDLNIPSIVRHALYGGPKYNDPAAGAPLSPGQEDRFSLGTMQLVPICYIGNASCPSLPPHKPTVTDPFPIFVGPGWHYFRPEVDNGALLRAFWSPDHTRWVLQYGNGSISEYGAPSDNPSDLSGTDVDATTPYSIYRWNLVRQYDTQRTPSARRPTNLIVYRWASTTSPPPGAFPLGGVTRGYLTDIFDTPPLADAPPSLGSFAHHTHLRYSPIYAGAGAATTIWEAVPTQYLSGVDVTSVQKNGATPREQVRRYTLVGSPLLFSSRFILNSVAMEGRCVLTANPVEDGNQLLPSTTGCPTRPATTFQYTSASAALQTTSINGAASFPLPMILDVNADAVADFILPPSPSSAIYQTLLINSGTRDSGGHAITQNASINVPPLAGIDSSTFRPGGHSFAAGAFSSNGQTNAVWLSLDTMPPYSEPGVHPPRDHNTVDPTATDIAWGMYTPSPPSQAGAAWNWLPIRTGSVQMARHMCPNMPGASDPYLSLQVPSAFAGCDSPYAFADVNGDGLTDMISSAWIEQVDPNWPSDSPQGPIWPFGTWPSSYVPMVRFSTRGATGATQPFATVPVNFGSSGDPNAVARYEQTIPNVCVPEFVPWNQRSGYFSATQPPVLADINGDGIVDWVRLKPAPATEIDWWPGHGDGIFGACADGSIACDCAHALPALTLTMWPHSIDVTKSHLHDVDGDGLADLIEVIPQGISIRRASGATGFQGPDIVDLTSLSWDPNSAQIVFADANGSGIDDIIFHTGTATIGSINNLGYIDYFSGGRPGLLTDILSPGVATHVTYGSGITLANDAAGIAAWQSTSPQPLLAVRELDVNVTAGGAYQTLYKYWDPVYDGRDRAFLGFTKVRTTRVGDTSEPTSNTDTTFLYGWCNDSGAHLCSITEDDPNRAIRGLPILTEIFGTSPDQLSIPYKATMHQKYSVAPIYIGMDGRVARRVWVSQTDNYVYDTAPFSMSNVTQSLSDLDMAGRTSSTTVHVRGAPAFHTVQQVTLDYLTNEITINDLGHVADLGNTVADDVLSRHEVWAVPPQTDGGSQWTWRLMSVDVGGYSGTGSTPIGLTRSTWFDYDAFGNEANAWATLSGVAQLPVRSHETSGQTAPLPVSASTNGTVHMARYTHDATGAGNTTRIERFPNRNGTAADVQCSDQFFDSYGQFVTSSTKYVHGCGSSPSLSTFATYDLGAEKPDSVISFDGTKKAVQYDEFGRPSQVFAPSQTTPGFTETSAFLTIDYQFTAFGEYTHSQLSDNGSTRQAWLHRDGLGRTVALITPADPAAGDPAPWIISGLVQRNAKGHPTNTFLPSFFSGTPSNPPLTGSGSSRSVAYDSFGRMVQSADLDGTITGKWQWHGLSVDVLDAENSKSTSVHAGAYLTRTSDGHGRATVETKRGNGGSVSTIKSYLPTGEVSRIQRFGTNISTTFERWMLFDSLGRMIANGEPNTSTGYVSDPAQSASMKMWRYAYDDVGQLVATSDARGCGENVAFDGAGRVVSEDYSPCLAAHAIYTPASSDGSGAGTEVFTRYDTTLGALDLGRVKETFDRAAHTTTSYDARGRVSALDRQIAEPGRVPVAVSDGYSPRVFHRDLTYDALDRPARVTTGADLPALMGSDGASAVTFGYSPRGFVQHVDGSYGTLVQSVTAYPDGLPDTVTYGDGPYGATGPHTSTVLGYDARRRPGLMQVARPSMAIWSSPPAGYSPPDQTTTQTQLLVQYFSLDDVGNTTQVSDASSSTWPTGAMPMTRTQTYDDDYRLKHFASQPTYGGTPTFVAPVAPASSAVSPVPYENLQNRVTNQTYAYDGLGNVTSLTGDIGSGQFYDRSLGTITHNTAPGPNQLSGVANALNVKYDASGNVVEVKLKRSFNIFSPVYCTDGGAGTMCTHLFVYDWDEVGRLSRGRRWDFDSKVNSTGPWATTYPAVPSFATSADVAYLYDVGGVRTIRGSTHGSTTYYDIDVYDSLRLRQATFDSTTTNEYLRTTTTEAVYLTSKEHTYGRLAYAPSAPTLTGNPLHVFLEMGDSLGSTAVVVDKETAELVERATYQAYGGLDSDYRPARWAAFRESEKFTGKEEDVEVGVVYFGARYYAPLLATWISADPLAIHAVGGDLNPYAYVRGRVGNALDPFGLDEIVIPEGAAEESVGIPALQICDGNCISVSANSPGWQGTPGGAGGIDVNDGLLAEQPTTMSPEPFTPLELLDSPVAHFLFDSPMEWPTIGPQIAGARNAAIDILAGSQESSGVPFTADLFRLLKTPEEKAAPEAYWAVMIAGLLVPGAGEEIAATEVRGGVYALRSAETGAIMRTGRTNDLVRRASEHARDPKLKELVFDVLFRTDEYAEQRGLEQFAHNEYHPPLNKIRPISPYNLKGKGYMEAATKFLEAR